MDHAKLAHLSQYWMSMKDACICSNEAQYCIMLFLGFMVIALRIYGRIIAKEAYCIVTHLSSFYAMWHWRCDEEVLGGYYDI